VSVSQKSANAGSFDSRSPRKLGLRFAQDDKIFGGNMKEKAGEMQKKGKNKLGPRLREVRRRAVEAMCPKVTKIAKNLAELAEKGNCQAAKLVFEFLGIFPAPQAIDDEEDDTLARYLLRELGIPDHPSEDEIAKVLNEGGEANADAVKSS
jgi:hypothetical protein